MLYSYGDMGEKLRILKPANKKVRFSLEELNERLQMGEKEVAVGGFRPLRESLIKLYTRDQENKKPGLSRLKSIFFLLNFYIFLILAFVVRL
ncbi:hypothetical protein HanOQP8_Chr13g0488671 [Helianthus annuus]|nr:hypothetical protein HanIR_Chr13g0647371 [Helianthus annuus]KAJ0671706.1 hypothetical protein HanOQP8_Chr13g0488671 [Helianthus annuus]